jgi:hypothetical protein
MQAVMNRIRRLYVDLSKMEEGRATMLAMPKIFDDGCVLQSGQDVPAWGWCEPWRSVTVMVQEHV